MTNSYGFGTGPYGTGTSAGRNGVAQAIMDNIYPRPQTPGAQLPPGAPGTPSPQATPGAQALGQSPMGAAPGLSPMAMATGQPQMAPGQPQAMPGLGAPYPPMPQVPAGGGGY